MKKFLLMFFLVSLHLTLSSCQKDKVVFVYATEDPDLSTDSNRPTYHAIPDIGWTNESYGLIYHNNEYHMFFQKNETFLGIYKQNWGRFTSDDLVHWDEQDAVLAPTPNSWDDEGCWSGTSIILQDGTPAVVYTGVDGVKAGMGVATSADNYATLQKSTSNPIIAVAPSSVDEFRDPFVWYEGGKYHMIIGAGNNIGGCIVYYSSDDFENWTGGTVSFQGIEATDGKFWEMPIIHKFDNGKWLLLVQDTPDDSGRACSFYWIGDFVNGVFTPDFAQYKKLELVNRFLSPTITVDQDNNLTAIGIIPDEVTGAFQSAQGWAHLFSVPQKWELNSTSDALVITPHPNLLTLRGSEKKFTNIDISGSNNLDGYRGRHFEMDVTITLNGADRVGFIFGKSTDGKEEYKVYYDVTTQKWMIDATKSSLDSNAEGSLDLREGESYTAASTIDATIYVDGSVLEVFVDGKAHFTGRFYPTLDDANGVELFSEGGAASANVTIYEIE